MGFHEDHVSEGRDKEGSGSRMNINWQVMEGVPDE